MSAENQNTKSQISTERNIQNIINYIKKLAKSKFFGTIEITFQSGKIFKIKEIRTYKPEEL